MLIGQGLRLVGGNFISWKSKETRVARSSCEVLYHSMANTVSEIVVATVSD